MTGHFRTLVAFISSPVTLCRPHHSARLSTSPTNRFRTLVRSLPNSARLRKCPAMCPTMSSSHENSKVEGDIKDEDDSSSDAEESQPPARNKLKQYAAITFYIGIVIYSLFLAPGAGSESEELSNLLSGKLNEMNDTLFAIFNLVGAMTFNYMVVLNPGASRQKRLPTRLFTTFGVFTGFLSLGPYLIGRQYVPSISKEEVEQHGFLSRILESRLFSFGTVLYSAWAYSYIFGFFTPGDATLHDYIFAASVIGWWRSVHLDQFVCATSIDFFILAVAFWDPLTEDMRRRGWFFKENQLESIVTALSILSTPGLGPALYLTLRPRLPSKAD